MHGQKSISQSLLDAVNSVTHAEVEEGFKELMQDVKDRAGPQPNGGAGIKQGTRYGGGRQKDDEREKETERLEKKKEVKKENVSFGDFKDRLIESLKGNQHKIDKNKNNKIDAHDFKILRAQKEEVELEEGNGYDDNRRGFGKPPREDDEYHVPDPTVKKTKLKKEEVKTSTKGLTVDTLAGPKKAPKGFEKDNEHTSAKVPLKQESVEEGVGSTLKKFAKKVGDTLGHGSDEDLKKDLQRKMGIPQTGKPSMAKQNEGKRPESDTVPFVTDAPQSPKERLRAALGKVKKEMSNGY
jgi:hypothetical protein